MTRTDWINWARFWLGLGPLMLTERHVTSPTGRRNAFQPNLQNIPLRTEEGKAIRDAFIGRGSVKHDDCDCSSCLPPTY